eukprot:562299-Rhodomonas_salina.2
MDLFPDRDLLNLDEAFQNPGLLYQSQRTSTNSGIASYEPTIKHLFSAQGNCVGDSGRLCTPCAAAVAATASLRPGIRRPK